MFIDFLNSLKLVKIGNVARLSRTLDKACCHFQKIMEISTSLDGEPWLPGLFFLHQILLKLRA